MNDIKDKKTNSSNQLKLIKNKIQKYSLGSQSIALMAGLLGITPLSYGSIIVLDGTNLFGETSSFDGSGSLGEFYVYYLTQSADIDDRIIFSGRLDNGVNHVSLRGTGGIELANAATIEGFPTIKYFSTNSSVDQNSTFSIGDIFSYTSASTNGLLGSWETDRTSGAIGFRNGDGEYGFIRVSWDASNKTMTLISGAFDNSPGTAITVTAVPEPSEYAAALGLGALGLAYYRRRHGNKTRSKNN